MDVFNVATLSDEECENDDGIQELVGGLNISDLSGAGTEFSVQVNEDAALETSLQTSYDGAKVFPHLNLSCLGPEEDDNSQPSHDADTPFSHLALSMYDLVDNGKVKKRILTEGYGETVPDNALVWFNYNSYKEGCDEPFDSTYLRGTMMMLRVNSGRCIMGLDIGLQSMKCEEKSEFLIHPDYAYGKLGVPPRIPEDATILIQVELKKFVDNALAIKMGELTEEELKLTPFEEVHKAALSLLCTGNADFSQRRYQTSVKMYRKALRMLENCDMKNDQEDDKNEKLRLKLYSNLGVCYNKMNHPKSAIVQCHNALRINPNAPKILYQLGLAHLNLSSFDEAKKYAFLARKYAPNNWDISMLLQKIEKKMERYNSSLVTFARSAFGFVENKSENGNNKAIKSSGEMKQGSSHAIPLESDANSSKNKSSKAKIVEIVEEPQETAEEKMKNLAQRSELIPAEQDLDDVERQFQREAVRYIQEFFDDPSVREVPLPSGLSYEEEKFFLTQASMYGLRKENREEDGRSQIMFLK